MNPALLQKGSNSFRTDSEIKDHEGEHHLEFLSLTEGCSCSSESTHVNMPHGWESHVVAHFIVCTRHVQRTTMNWSKSTSVSFMLRWV